MKAEKRTTCEEEGKQPFGIHVAPDLHPTKLWIGRSELYGYEITEHPRWISKRCGFEYPHVVSFCARVFERLYKVRLDVGEVRQIESINVKLEGSK